MSNSFHSSIDPAKLAKIQAEYSIFQQTVNMKLALQRRKEDCLLALAISLLLLNKDCEMTWAAIASAVSGITDKSHAYKLAHRKVGISRISYALACSSINEILGTLGKPLLEFPEFPPN